MAKTELTDTLIANLKHPASGFVRVWDAHKTAPPGFAVVAFKGAKSFVLAYRSKAGDRAGKERRLAIAYADRRSLLSPGDARAQWEQWLKPGNKPHLTVAVAREFARILHGQIAAGFDPLATRQSVRNSNAARAAAPTVTALAKDYLTWAKDHKRQRSIVEDVSLLRQYIIRADDWNQIDPDDEKKRPINPELEKRKLGRHKVADIVRADIEKLYRAIVKGEWSPDRKPTPVRGNLLLILVSKMMNLACEWGLRTDNPVKGIKREAGNRRTRYLDPKTELPRLVAALDKFNDRHGINAVRLLLLTGARRGEVLHATWDQFDLDAGTWTKPSGATKQKREHVVDLSPQAVAVLRQMRRDADQGHRRADALERQLVQEKDPFERQRIMDRVALARTQHSSAFLFPSIRRDGAPIESVRKLWSAICVEAKITGIRLHDVRHSFASFLLRQGHSLQLIGHLLGHSQPQTTARYSHIMPDHARAAATDVGKMIAGAGRKRQSAQVVKLEPRR
jgi:integrase